MEERRLLRRFTDFHSHTNFSTCTVEQKISFLLTLVASIDRREKNSAEWRTFKANFLQINACFFHSNSQYWGVIYFLTTLDSASLQVDFRLKIKWSFRAQLFVPQKSCICGCGLWFSNSTNLTPETRRRNTKGVHAEQCSVLSVCHKKFSDDHHSVLRHVAICHVAEFCGGGGDTSCL